MPFLAVVQNSAVDVADVSHVVVLVYGDVNLFLLAPFANVALKVVRLVRAGVPVKA